MEYNRGMGVEVNSKEQAADHQNRVSGDTVVAIG
jgi:hypothetical protein